MAAFFRKRTSGPAYRLAGALCTTLAWIVMGTVSSHGGAATYIVPDDSTELIQLEHIPLQIHDMRELSDHLVVIARRKHDASAANQQATGRLLLLAMQLDPFNPRARETGKILAAGKTPTPPLTPVLDKSKASLQKLQSWLASPNAGTEANKLANYLLDATKMLRQETSANKDLANWHGTLPPLSKYPSPKKEATVSAGKDTPPKPKDPQADRTPAKNEPTTPAKVSAGFRLVEQTVFTPLTLQSQNQENGALFGEVFDEDKQEQEQEREQTATNQVTAVTLKLKSSDQKTADSGYSAMLTIDHFGNRAFFQSIDKTLKDLLTSRHPNLPGYHGEIKIAAGSCDSSNRLNLTAPIALMLEASLANTPLRDDIHILAVVNREGVLIQPANFWEMLITLRRSSGGGRLIVSPASAALMPQILVYQEPDFFTRWEVYSAEDIDQALAAAIGRSAPDLAEAGELFQSIRSLTDKTEVTQLAVNSFVRNRLEEIVNLAPNHVSATTLLLQGSGKRPMHLNEQALALELLPLVQTLNHILTDNNSLYQLDADDLRQHHGSAREKIDPLERIIARNNDSLYRDTLKLVNDFRSLALLQERNKGNRRTEFSEKKAESLFAGMRRLSNQLLRQAVTDADPQNPRKPR